MDQTKLSKPNQRLFVHLFLQLDKRLLADICTVPMQLGHERVVGAEHISHGKTSQAVISTFILLVRGAAQKFVTYLFG